MNKYELLQIVERIQTDADEMAYNLVKAGKLAKIQSICTFNVFWMSEVSHLVMTDQVIDFLSEFSLNFKRKLSVREFLNADFLIRNLNIQSWDEFINAYKSFNPEIFNNILSKI